MRVAPRWRHSEGPDAAFLASGYGLTPYPWQEIFIDDALAYRADGRWSSTRVGLSAPRQNGKNGGIEVVELYQLVALNRRILHTAHEVKTNRKAFLRLASFFTDRRYPELADLLVGPPRRVNGQEGIYLKSGASIEFVARSKGSARGFTVDTLVMDEAQDLGREAYAALLPTISTSENPQQIIAGTPPTAQTDGEVFTRLRADALSGRSRRTTWLEWSMDADADPDDRAQWYKANPSLGASIDIETVEDERSALDDASFMRERGGVWQDQQAIKKVIAPQTWTALTDPSSREADGLALAVDIAPEGTAAAIGVAGERADGRWHVELAEHRAGASWVVERVVGMVGRHDIGSVVIDGASQAVNLVEPLRARGVVVTVTGPQAMGAACTGFMRHVLEDSLRHLGQPQLASAVDVARKRLIGKEGLWGWGRAVSGADISPVVAVTLALWGAQSTTIEKQKRRRTGEVVFR